MELRQKFTSVSTNFAKFNSRKALQLPGCRSCLRLTHTESLSLKQFGAKQTEDGTKRRERAAVQHMEIVRLC